MNITIYKAEKLPDEYSSNPEFSYQLPSGFPFLVDDDNLDVVEPALLYLVDRFVKYGQRGRYNTRKAVAYDLCDWWNFLVERGRAWNTVDADLVAAYRDARLHSISIQTHEALTSDTVRRRMNYVFNFYEWAYDKGLVDTVDLGEKVERVVRANIDTDFFAHTRARNVSMTFGHQYDLI